MDFDTYEYRIAGVYLPALINGDYSGLEDEDCELLTQFVASLPEGASHWECTDDSHFARCEVCGLRADVVDCTLYVVRG